MDRATLRQFILDGIDRIEGHPFFVSDQDRQYLDAERVVIGQDNDATNAYLDALLAQMNASAGG